MTDKDTYEVGYGNPPKHTRFKKGQSGNRKGRTKGSRNFKTELDEVLNEQMTITHQGKPKKVSARKAALLRLREKAIGKGDMRALEKWLEFAMEHWDEQQSTNTHTMKSQDHEILQRYKESLRSADTPDVDQTEEDSSDDI